MLGTTLERPTSPDGQHMAPIMAYGLATNSIGYLVTDDNAMVWRTNGKQSINANAPRYTIVRFRLFSYRYATRNG